MNDEYSNFAQLHNKRDQSDDEPDPTDGLVPTCFAYQNGGYSSFNREIDRFFDELGGVNSAKSNASPPRISVRESDDAMEVWAELLGVDEKDLDVELRDDVLTIKGEKRAERDETHKDAYYHERTFGRFARTITLPFEPDPKTVKTHFARGVLKITLPKSAGAKEHTVKIPVKAAA